LFVEEDADRAGEVLPYRVVEKLFCVRDDELM
jgi:hypothetical protein